MQLHDIDDPSTQEKLTELIDPAAAELVRSLHLRPYTEPGLCPPEKRSWVNLSPSGGWKSKMRPKKSREGRSLLCNLRGLKSLEHLDLQCQRTDDVEAFTQILPLLKLSWVGYSSSLRSLTLRIPLECYQGLFAPSLLPRLTKLTVYIFASHHSTNPVEPMCSALVPFINRHVLSLESLSVVTPETGTADLSPMFFNLRYFPRLTTIHLAFCALSLDYINLKGIQEFFSSHSHQLQDVALHFNRMVGLKAEDFGAEAFFSLPVFRVPLASLTSLAIGFTGFRDSTGLGTIKYVHRFKDTLQHLAIHHTQLSTASLLKLVTPITSLRSLEVAVPHCTPLVLDILSTHLLELTDLCLSFMSYSGTEDSSNDPSSIHLFCAEMTRRLYPGWSLRRLKTRVINAPATPRYRSLQTPPPPSLGRAGSPLLPKVDDICLRALANALPSIQTIDGLRRSSLLSLERSPSHSNLSVYED